MSDSRQLMPPGIPQLDVTRAVIRSPASHVQGSVVGHPENPERRCKDPPGLTACVVLIGERDALREVHVRTREAEILESSDLAFVEVAGLPLVQVRNLEIKSVAVGQPALDVTPFPTSSAGADGERLGADERESHAGFDDLLVTLDDMLRELPAKRLGDADRKLIKPFRVAGRDDLLRELLLPMWASSAATTVLIASTRRWYQLGDSSKKFRSATPGSPCSGSFGAGGSVDHAFSASGARACSTGWSR